MPLNITREQAALLEPYLAEPMATPQSMFGIAPPAPTTSYFTPVPTGNYGGRGGYDPYAINAKAAEYRMAQDAEMQAQQLFQQVGLIDPADPSYLAKRQQLITQLPLATRNPMGKSAIDALDFTYAQSRQNPNRGLEERAAIAGVLPEEIAQFRMPNGQVDTVALGNLVGERTRANRPKKAEYSQLDREVRALTKTAEGLDKIGKGGTSQAKMIKSQLEQKSYDLARQNGVPIEAVAVAAPAQPAATTPALPRVNSPDEARKLPSGTQFIDSNGTIRRVP